MRRRFVGLVTIRYICVTSSLVDTYESDLLSQAKSHVVTFVKMLPIDGSSLCLQCDMIVHVGGKRTHGRYLMLRQRVEFPGDKPGSGDEPGSQRVMSSLREKDNHQQNHRISSDQILGDNNGDGKMENKLIDLNARPQRMYGQTQTNQEHMDNLVGNNHGSTSVIPDGYFKREHEK
ncbi:B-box zinc finger protein 19 [Phtheirospermum japonicum]|uniref:B-box zinc finger protein 19 n=1 Tax=Phtheirospermum japonicum TaxID=374723 RepID=A0A830BLN7_9LAMI|nr:B-box zinc finger protein 19 [Phtheirospermum japonicum]